MRIATIVVTTVLLFATADAHAKEDDRPNHGQAAIGGAVAGLVCGGGTLVYAKAREHAGSSGPLLWHSEESPAWVGVFFLEHAAVGGLTGALGEGSRQGFVIGGAVTCALDIVWIVSAEILAKQARDDDETLARLPPPAGFAELSPNGWRFGPPPVVVTRRGAWMSLFAWRF